MSHSYALSPDEYIAQFLELVTLQHLPLHVMTTQGSASEMWTRKNWWPRKVTVRGGQLVVSSRRSDDCLPTLRLPLRQLSLQAGPLVNSLALTKGSIIVLTIQTSTEQHFDLWVKAIAIELIRQTPIFAVKYLDILNLTGKFKKNDNDETDCNCNNLFDKFSDNNRNTEIKERCDAKSVRIDELSSSNSNDRCDGVNERLIEEKKVETILKKCQNVETYVPVKEKLVLFESLCRLGRKVRSTEDVSYRSDVETKRARSMHDLSNFGSHIAVREICKYFENKTEPLETRLYTTFSERNKRPLSSDSQLEDVRAHSKLSNR
ncbi:hypothetical protein WA026_010815 [Henosepilachna vigintioctopunctata]|uniref:PH domain-containing protein n=1 Tax=Henosepilachna vigintioctopunctata TaxID=420089 RepID=A0AAW1UWV1_9CUCU